MSDTAKPQFGKDKPCPSCDSTNFTLASFVLRSLVRKVLSVIVGGIAGVATMQGAGSFIAGFVVFLIVSFAGTSFPLYVKTKCNDCGHEWTKQV